MDAKINKLDTIFLRSTVTNQTNQTIFVTDVTTPAPITLVNSPTTMVNYPTTMVNYPTTTVNYPTTTVNYPTTTVNYAEQRSSVRENRRLQWSKWVNNNWLSTTASKRSRKYTDYRQRLTEGLWPRWHARSGEVADLEEEKRGQRVLGNFRRPRLAGWIRKEKTELGRPLPRWQQRWWKQRKKNDDDDVLVIIARRKSSRKPRRSCGGSDWKTEERSGANGDGSG